MNKIIISLLIIIIIFLAVIFFVGRKDYGSFTNEHAESTDTVQLVSVPEKITWYKIISPVKNEGKGFLYLKTETNTAIDSSRISPAQAAAFTGLLKEKEVLFSWETKSIIVTAEIPAHFAGDSANSRPF